MTVTSRPAGETALADGPLQQPELDLSAFLRILRRRFWVVVLVPILVTGAAYASSRAKTPLYRSSADILLGRTQAETLFNPLETTSADPSRQLANQIRVIRSQELVQMVKARLGYAPTIQASASTTEDVITLKAVSSKPERAAAVVNAYTDAYLKFRLSSGASQNAAAQVELRHEIEAAQGQLDILDRAVAAQAKPDQQAQLRAGQADQRTPLVSQLATEQTQLSQLQAAAAVDQGGAQLLAPGPVPTVPFAPTPLRSGALGLGVGLMLGLGLAFLLDYLDNRIRGKDELERVTGNLPVIGMIPIQPDWRDPKVAQIVSLKRPDSGSAEAYRTLRTSIQFLGLDRSLHTLQVTSPTTAEGKTTTVINLAVALARAGQRVIVVDCDLRRPRVHAFMGMDPDPGFTSVLLGESSLSDVLRPVPGVDGLRALTAGPIPPNPSELLSGRRAIQLFEALKADSDFVLIDSPPVLPVSDAAVIATSVDAILMVVKDNNTHRKHLVRSLELLRQVDATVIGTVLNLVGKSAGYGYGYHYSYRYAAKPSSKNGKVTAPPPRPVGAARRRKLTTRPPDKRKSESPTKGR